MITCKGRTELLKMERATWIVQQTLADCVAACRPGVTTEEIDRIAADGIRRKESGAFHRTRQRGGDSIVDARFAFPIVLI